MIKTCNGCRALETSIHSKCLLGYKLEVVKTIMGVQVGCKPSSGDCPKPKNNDDLCYYMLNKDSK